MSGKPSKSRKVPANKQDYQFLERELRVVRKELELLKKRNRFLKKGFGVLRTRNQVKYVAIWQRNDDGLAASCLLCLLEVYKSSYYAGLNENLQNEICCLLIFVQRRKELCVTVKIMCSVI